MANGLKLPCGCVPGLGFCAEGQRLALELDKAYGQCRNAPASDFGWLRYQDAQVNFYMHFKGEMDHEPAKTITQEETGSGAGEFGREVPCSPG